MSKVEFNRDLFEQICIRNNWSVNRHPEGLLKGQYCDQRTQMAMLTLIAYLQEQSRS